MLPAWFALLFSISPSKQATGWQFVPAVVSSHRDLPGAVPVPVQISEAAVWRSFCAYGLFGFFFLVFCFYKWAAIALCPKQAVLLFLHWPDGCRVVTCGFLQMPPDASRPRGERCTVRSQTQQRSTFCSPSGLSHKVGAASGWDSPHID